jgi:hypothetical protein
MTPNPENYGTLPACQALEKAGIVMETDQYWSLSEKKLYPRSTIVACKSEIGKQVVPAPMWAEMWREFPDSITSRSKDADGETSCWINGSGVTFKDANPCDALIHLRIWLKERGEKENV